MFLTSYRSQRLTPEPLPVADILPWRGRGNVIAAFSVALLDMVGESER